MDVFVTEVRQLDFLLNTGKKKQNTSIIKREKPFDSFLLPDLHNAGTEEQTSRRFRSHSKLPAASQCSPTTLSSSWMGTEPLSKLLGAYKSL